MPLPLVAVAVGWGLSKLAQGIAVTRELANTIPRLEDEVTVEVIGQPGSTKQQLYFLALAAANGLVHKFSPLVNLNPLVAPTMGMVMIEYDAADNWVRATLRYNTSTLAAATTGDRRKTYPNELAVLRGPSCDVVGEAFNFTSLVIPGIPLSAISGPDPPNLPFENQTILTPCPEVQEPRPTKLTQNPAVRKPAQRTREIPSPNPKPPGDNRSRGVIPAYVAGGSNVINPTLGGGSMKYATSPSSSGATSYVQDGKCCPAVDKLAALVFAALSDPGGNVDTTFVSPDLGPAGG